MGLFVAAELLNQKKSAQTTMLGSCDSIRMLR